jgi:hypothetical protein
VITMKRKHWGHFDYIAEYFVKEHRGLFHKVAAGFFGVFFLKEIKMYPLLSL